MLDGSTNAIEIFFFYRTLATLFHYENNFKTRYCFSSTKLSFEKQTRNSRAYQKITDGLVMGGRHFFIVFFTNELNTFGIMEKKFIQVDLSLRYFIHLFSVFSKIIRNINFSLLFNKWNSTDLRGLADVSTNTMLFEDKGIWKTLTLAVIFFYLFRM